MTSVITATALVVRPPGGTAGSAYREIGRACSRTSTIRMTSPSHFHSPIQRSHGAVVSSFGRQSREAIAKLCSPTMLGEREISDSYCPDADMARILWSSTELTSRDGFV